MFYRELLYTLSETELSMLEKGLCSSEEPEMSTQSVTQSTASQSDALLQIDQGFHEEGEGIVLVNTIGSNLLPSCESPVTPVNLLPDSIDFGQLSPSSTIVDDFQDNDLTEGSLNKSESQDSGLQSENVSTSDTVTVDSPQLVSHEHGAAGCETVPAVSELTQGIDLKQDSANCDDSGKTCDNKNRSDVNTVTDEELVNPCSVRDQNEALNVCRQIVEELVNNALQYAQQEISVHNSEHTSGGTGEGLTSEVSGTDAEASSSPGMSRQFSWQYNVQFALPRITLSDREVDRQSADSFSSDSTLSDHGHQADNVSDFVIETLANMNATSHTTSSNENSARSLPGSKTNHKKHRGAQKGKSPQKHLRKGSNGCAASSSSHSKALDLSLPSSSQTLHQNTATKPKPRSTQERRDSVENISCETGAQSGCSGVCDTEDNPLHCTDSTVTLSDNMADLHSAQDSVCDSDKTRKSSQCHLDKTRNASKCDSDKTRKSSQSDAGSVSSSCSSCQSSSCDCESEQNW